jgi:hypothetical protein
MQVCFLDYQEIGAPAKRNTYPPTDHQRSVWGPPQSESVYASGIDKLLVPQEYCNPRFLVPLRYLSTCMRAVQHFLVGDALCLANRHAARQMSGQVFVARY